MNQAQIWRMRAEETRVIAEEYKQPAVRRALLGAAADYDRRAEQLEKRLAQSGKTITNY